MFAVLRTGGKQYRVAARDKIVVEKLAGEALMPFHASLSATVQRCNGAVSDVSGRSSGQGGYAGRFGVNRSVGAIRVRGTTPSCT